MKYLLLTTNADSIELDDLTLIRRAMLYEVHRLQAALEIQVFNDTGESERLRAELVRAAALSAKLDEEDLAGFNLHN